MGKLDGKVALVTGGSSGIGLATAQEFVAEGAYVFITGRREAELVMAVKEIGRNVSSIRADVSESHDLDRLFSQIRSEKGKFDIVFANAGILQDALTACHCFGMAGIISHAIAALMIESPVQMSITIRKPKTNACDMDDLISVAIPASRPAGNGKPASLISFDRMAWRILGGMVRFARLWFK